MPYLATIGKGDVCGSGGEYGWNFPLVGAAAGSRTRRINGPMPWGVWRFSVVTNSHGTVPPIGAMWLEMWIASSEGELAAGAGALQLSSFLYYPCCPTADPPADGFEVCSEGQECTGDPEGSVVPGGSCRCDHVDVDLSAPLACGPLFISLVAVVQTGFSAVTVDFDVTADLVIPP